jgi:hypothetical protein
MIRSRRAGLSRDEARQQPLYARVLGLQYLAPGGFLCFVFLEGAVALGILLALAELVSWWGVVVLPMTVAIMVKLNDVVAGALIRTTPMTADRTTPMAAGRTPPTTAGRINPMTAGRTTPAESPGAETVRLSPSMISQVNDPAPEGGSPALRSATTRRIVADAMPGARGEERWIASGTDASALNVPPVTRKWTEELDDRQQRARQSAARRYE